MSDNERGRPTKYKKEYAEQAKKFCLLGASNEQIADFFNVTVSTYHLWRNKHPEFDKAVLDGKLMADANVANALYKRAVGFEVKKEKHANFEGKFTDKVEYTEEVIPDVGAATKWLKNRQPEIWGEREEKTHTETVVIVGDIDDENTTE